MERLMHKIDVVAGARPELSSLIFVSTDTNGTPGDLNRSVQESVGVELPVDPKLLASQGYQIEKLPRGPLLVWIVTVGGKGATAEQLNRNLRSALPKALDQLISFESGSRLWVPLMGTGAGGLDHKESAQETLEALGDVLSSGDYPELEVIISLHPRSKPESVDEVWQVARSERFENTWAASLDSKPDKSGNSQETGFGLKFQRETSENLALDRDKFALALARLFRIANEEFSLALLGRWGSGKTTIANRITRYLSDSESYSSDFGKVFGQEPTQEVDRSYEVVEFNAWRYRRQPELWIWLYESFVSTFLDCGFGARIIRPIRAGVEKHGFYSTIIRLLLLAIMAFPFMWLTLVLPYGVALFGISGLIGLAFLVRRWQGSLRSLVDRYGLVASHRDKLGMQAMVGEDLKSLVKSWAKTRQFSQPQKYAFTAILLSVGALWGTAFVGGADGILVNALQKFSTSFAFTEAAVNSENLTLSVSFVAWIVWCAIVICFGVAVLTDYARVDRILLVVDDLDRCPQEEIVDLIDGIKLMIDDKEVGAVVQVLVLADDTILETAIGNRFTNRHNNGARNQPSHEAQWRAAVREHMEKVFLCHISIPVLKADDLEPLIEVFGREFGVSGALPATTGSSSALSQSLASSTTVTKSETVGQGRSISASLGSDGSREGTLSVGSSETSGTTTTSTTNFEGFSTSEGKVAAEIVLSQLELSALKSALHEQFKKPGLDFVVTPRSVRSLLFKYQLARMILQANDMRVDAEELASPLVNRVFSGEFDPSEAVSRTRDEVAWVVALVV